MKLYILLFAFILSITCGISYAQDPYHFEKSETILFPNGQANMVSYINFPDRTAWGWIKVSITGGYNSKLNRGVLSKRTSIVHNASTSSVHFSSNTEVLEAVGELATQWNIGDYDPVTRRIPIYHISPTGNNINIKVEGQMVTAATATDFQNLITFSTPVIVENTNTRQYKSIMEDRVGIGTLNPMEKLSVNGNVRAHEIKVETQNWPDYVFDEDYQRSSIEQLESYIKEHKHLPGIPSANEVEKDGVALGELNKRLLKHIEELTLIVIEQGKALKRLQGNKD